MKTIMKVYRRVKTKEVVNVPDDINLDQDINIKTTSDKEVV